MASLINHIGELPLFEKEYADKRITASVKPWLLPLVMQGDKEMWLLFDREHEDWDLNTVQGLAEDFRAAGWKVSAKAAARVVISDIRHGGRQEESRTAIERDSVYKDEFTNILMTAIDRGASDIHVEVRLDEAQVRLSLPGGKVPIKKLTPSFASAMVRHLYQWEAGNGKGTAESFYKGEIQPQKARLDFPTPRGNTELRVQITPAFPEGGVDMVARILLVRSASYLKEISRARSLEDLGYLPEDQQNIWLAVNMPNGMCLLVGVVNSGKSTTIANILRALLHRSMFRLKVVTLEDPPETEIVGATQTNVEKMRLGLELSGVSEDIDSRIYAEGIKVALRMDMDKLFIGEIRGAEMAMPLTNAIRSGHYVFATLHAGSSVEAFGRLWNLGLDIGDLASPSFVNLIVYQKLVSGLCPHCKVPGADWPEVLAPHREDILAWYERQGARPVFYHRHPQGCEHPGCNGGVSRRVLIAETCLLTDALREVLLERNLIRLRQAWIAGGGRPIAHHGLLRVGAGEVDMADLIMEAVRWPDLLEWVNHGR